MLFARDGTPLTVIKTISEINAAIKEIKNEIKETPTYYKLKLAGEV